MKPVIKIGLTYTGTEHKHHNYVNWLKGTDDIEIITLSAENNNAEQVKELDAIVLSGGIDAHPNNYGNTVIDYPNAPVVFNEARDAFETEVFHQSQQYNKPVLAVCRGMQLVNCILGGTLTQDIGNDANAVHKNEGADKKHNVHILPGSLLNEITKLEQDNTNSAHHQAVNKIGDGLQVNAKSDDGIVEGVEWMDKAGKPFFLGVQWHPERMVQAGMEASPLSKNIRDFFIQEIKKSN